MGVRIDGGIAFRPGGVWVPVPGRFVPYSPDVLRDAARFVRYYAAVRAGGGRPERRRALRVAFAPQVPTPWYLARPVLDALGVRIVSPDRADVLWAFEDATVSDRAFEGAGLPVVNGECRDVSKSAVARAFEAVSGTRLGVDPCSHVGPMVEKAEENGAHDGRVLVGPAPRRRGRAYQRLIDNRLQGGADGDLVEDLRTPIVDGRPILVFRKHRPAADRFANFNSAVSLTTIQATYTPDEIALLERFCGRIGLDCGGLDVLRDRSTGGIFVVDANKTDMGPPLALPLRDQLRATRLMAEATGAYLEKLVGLRSPGAARTPERVAA